MVSLTPIPPSLVPITENRSMTLGWYQFFRSLFQTVQALASGVILYSATTNLVAAGTTQGTATLVTADWSQFTTVPANSGCILANQLGLAQTIFNAGANTLKVYPPSGATIDALGLNNPYSLPVGKMQTFYQLSTTVFNSTNLG